MKFVAIKKDITNFFTPSLLLLFLDPGSEIPDPGWVKIRIRDKHPGSVTLVKSIIILCHWAHFFFSVMIKNKIIFSSLKFVATE